MAIIKLPKDIKEIESHLGLIEKELNTFSSKEMIKNYFNKNNKYRIEHRAFDMIFYNLENGALFKLDSPEIKKIVYEFILKIPKTYNMNIKKKFLIYFYLRRKKFIYKEFENLMQFQEISLHEILDTGVEFFKGKVDYLSEINIDEFFFIEEIIDYLIQKKEYGILLKNKILLSNIKFENYDENHQKEIKIMCKMYKTLVFDYIKGIFIR